jgi:hypothetical protein
LGRLNLMTPREADYVEIIPAKRPDGTIAGYR